MANDGLFAAIDLRIEEIIYWGAPWSSSSSSEPDIAEDILDVRGDVCKFIIFENERVSDLKEYLLRKFKVLVLISFERIRNIYKPIIKINSQINVKLKNSWFPFW